MPHVVSRLRRATRKKVVVVGAGPAGLEAARVAARARPSRRGASRRRARPGGQVRLTAQLKRRREIMGIVDWRARPMRQARCRAALQHSMPRSRDVLAEEPDIVVVATGGVPNTSFLDAGEELVTTSWDILSGAAKPAESVLLYDDNGAHPGMTAAEFIVGARLAARDRHARARARAGGRRHQLPRLFQGASRSADAKITLNLRLERVTREGNRLVAPSLQRLQPPPGASDAPSRSWSSTALCRTTNCISR